MDQTAQSYDVDLEEGELSEHSDDGYTPLQRPSTLVSKNNEANTAISVAENSPLSTCHKQLQRALEEEDDELDKLEDSDSSTSSSMSCSTLQQKSKKADATEKRKKRTMMVRMPATESDTRARFKKYDVWTAALQEDTLTETLRDCGVQRSSDRNVENYDFSLRHRLNGENSLKRRFSNSTDDYSDNEQERHLAKRGRPSNTDKNHKRRCSVKSRLGQYVHSANRKRDSSHTSGSSEYSDEPRFISDLVTNISDLELVEAAREIANKLHEENDDLMVRIVEVLGIEIPVEIFKETQRIEADGGMLIKNGARRRTPGGVFLFLLKNDERLTEAQKKLIFDEFRQNDNKRRKNEKNLSRDRKVQELKKRLNEQQPELPALRTRSDVLLLGNDLSLQHKAAVSTGSAKLEIFAVSNPPPSPAGNEQQSPDYKAQDMIADKPTSSHVHLNKPMPVSYEDDFLDVNSTEMDLF